MASAQLVTRENNIAHLKVSVGAEEVDHYFKQVYKEFSKNLNISGFRKGKVPENVIRQRVGAENITGAVADELKQYAVDFALDELKLTPRSGNTRWLSEPDPVPATAIEYEVSVPVLPEVTLPDYKVFELTVPVLTVTDDMKDHFRKRMVERFTEFADKDEPAAAGDAMLITFTTTGADGEATSLAYEDMVYRLGMEGNFPGWDDALAGSTAGQHHDFEFTVPADFADPRVAGQPVKVNLDVKSVHFVNEPELTAEFVKEHVGVDTLEQFEEHVDRMLHMERDQQVQQMKSELVMQKLCAEMEADISEDMVAGELDGLVKEYDAQLRQHGSSLDQYVKDKDQTLAEYRETLSATAVQKIKVFLAVKTIAEAQEMNATGEDFQRYAYYLMQREGVPAEKLKELVNNPEFMQEATYQIVREKVLTHLSESAKFNETEAVDEEDATPAVVDESDAGAATE